MRTHITDMSRLDIFIDRMVSQRACLDHAAAATAHLPGPVFELGLGNGRTYHYMSTLFAVDDFWVFFDRNEASHPGSAPPSGRIICGDVIDTMPQARARFGPTVRLIHADLGGHDLTRNDAFARRLSPLVAPLLAKGGLLVSSDRMYCDSLDVYSLPVNAVSGRCFLDQRRA